MLQPLLLRTMFGQRKLPWGLHSLKPLLSLCILAAFPSAAGGVFFAFLGLIAISSLLLSFDLSIATSTACTHCFSLPCSTSFLLTSANCSGDNINVVIALSFSSSLDTRFRTFSCIYITQLTFNSRQKLLVLKTSRLLQ